MHDRTLKGTTVDSSLQIRQSSVDEIKDPTIACHDGYCLAAWNEFNYSSDFEWTIVGQRLAPDCYTLTTSVNPPGSGSVAISAPPNCDGGTKYLEGTSLVLNAIPAGGYTFSHWSGDANATISPIIIEITSDTSITANFTESYNIYLPLIVKQSE